jgi:acyl-CoA dehydrogenase
MDGFNHARVLVASACIGSAEAILEEGLKYIKEREAFGVKLKDLQSIAFEAAELYTKLEMARLLVYKSAWMLDHEENFKDEISKFSAMAKLIAPQTAFDVIKSVMIWFGAYGYTKDALIESGMRGLMSYLVGAEGALNIMKLIISREILK